MADGKIDKEYADEFISSKFLLHGFLNFVIVFSFNTLCAC